MVVLGNTQGNKGDFAERFTGLILILAVFIIPLYMTLTMLTVEVNGEVKPQWFVFTLFFFNIFLNVCFLIFFARFRTVILEKKDPYKIKAPNHSIDFNLEAVESQKEATEKKNKNEMIDFLKNQYKADDK